MGFWDGYIAVFRFQKSRRSTPKMAIYGPTINGIEMWNIEPMIVIYIIYIYIIYIIYIYNIYIYIYYIWVNYNDLTTTSLEIMVSKGNHPQMAQQFRLVKYYNLPIYIYTLYIYILYIYIYI